MTRPLYALRHAGDDDVYMMTAEEFLTDNECVSLDQASRILGLNVGEAVSDGGGAAAEWSLTRVS